MRYRVLAAASSAAVLAGCSVPEVPRSLQSAPTTPIVVATQVPGVPALTPAQATLDLARQFVYRVRNVDCDATGTAFATGGQMVTNRHVASGTDVLELATWSGSDFHGSVTGLSGTLDLADVKMVEHQGGKEPPIADADPKTGQAVFEAGYPEGGQLTVESGYVLNELDGAQFGMAGKILVISDKVEPGNSGSPLIDSAGKIVGIVFASQVHGGYGLAIPASSIRSFLASTSQPVSPDCVA